MRDVSVVITARNEEFLARTVEGILENKRANTEIIVICDGNWPNPPIKDNPDVTMIYRPASIGQRAAINEGIKLSTAKYVMKLDAHCIVDEGFDVKLMADCEYDWTVIPAMYNLHAFDWVCSCGNRRYQGPTPDKCEKCGGKMEREMIWKPRLSRRSEFMRFDSDLHFQYWSDYKKRPEAKGDIVEIMSFIGACFFIHRERYWDIDGLDEEHGSWGQMGTEIACKTWLSGGKLMVNKKTWFSHMFRTQGGDFGFPYPQSGRQVEHARKHSQDLWRNGKWPKAIHTLDWLVEKFAPVPGWDNKTPATVTTAPQNKGIVYYTDNQLKVKIHKTVKRQILKMGLPIVSASLKPMDFGKNFVINLPRGYEAYFTQILTALENSDAEIIFFCEHDWIYHKSHFDFNPPEKDRYYYNDNWWRLRVSDGHAVTYKTHTLPSICAYRELLVNHYRKHLEKFKQGVSVMGMGFEPGTNHRHERVDDFRAEGWVSEYPNIDLRHENNLTRSKWKQSDFRDPRNCRDWQEKEAGDDIPGWGKIDDIIRRLK